MRPGTRDQLMFGATLLVVAIGASPALACGRGASDELVNQAPGGGRLGGDADGDGTPDMEFPSWRMPGDTATPPRCKLYCVSNHGFLPLFLIKCDGMVVHRCPYKGAMNDWRRDDQGRYHGSSEEGAYPSGVGNDADHDGVVEKVEYEEKLVGGNCVLEVRTYHDGRLVETRQVPCPERPEDLPWPKEPGPSATPPAPPPPPEEPIPALGVAWLLGIAAGVTVVGAYRKGAKERLS